MLMLNFKHTHYTFFRVQNNNQQTHAQTTKMTYVTRAYRDQMCSWKREAIPHACLLCKKYMRKHFVQLKTIDFNGRRIFLMLRLRSTYYAFGCKKYICKKCHLGNLYGCNGGTCVACNKKKFVDFSILLEGDVIRYGLNSFYYCNKCLADKNVSMNEKRFDVRQIYIPRSMILSNQPTRFLGYNHRMNQLLNLCRRGEICNKVNDLIKKEKESKVTVMCIWEMTIIYLRMSFITTMDAGRLSAIFAAMHIHPSKDGNGRRPENIMMRFVY